MGTQNDISKGNGEFVIGTNAIYTFAHYYRRPDTDRRVVLVGMDHFADVDYFEEVKGILRPCDLVLSEDVMAERLNPEAKKTMVAWVKKQLFSNSVDEALLAAVTGSYAAIAIMLAIPYEGDSFANEHNQASWVNADLFVDMKIEEKFYVMLEERLKAIPSEQKQCVVDHARRALEIMERGEFTMHDFRNFLVSVEFDEIIDQIMFDVMVSPRDSHCLEKFDSLVNDRQPKFIGIKFGAIHISGQRALLERRGYIHEKSRRIRALAL